MFNTESVQPLLRPFTLGNLNLSNRTVMAPMTRNLSPNGVMEQTLLHTIAGEPKIMWV